MGWPILGYLKQALSRSGGAISRPPFQQDINQYCDVDISKELRQAEIISNLTYYKVGPNKDDKTKVDTFSLNLPYAIIMTPDCDLLQDYNAEETKRYLNGILIFEMEEAPMAKKRSGYGGSEWKHVTNNEWDRFHFLEAINAECDALKKGIPELVIDFRRYFTLPVDEIYRQCSLQGEDKASRRCRLGDLWRENIQRRAMFHMHRVALPD